MQMGLGGKKARGLSGEQGSLRDAHDCCYHGATPALAVMTYCGLPPVLEPLYRVLCDICLGGTIIPSMVRLLDWACQIS